MLNRNGFRSPNAQAFERLLFGSPVKNGLSGSPAPVSGSIRITAPIRLAGFSGPFGRRSTSPLPT